MLEDFSTRNTGGARLGFSVLIALGVFGAAMTTVVVASAAVRTVMIEEDLVQVELAPLPELEEEPPPPVVDEPPPPAPEEPVRRGRPRPELVMPEEIPDETPDESDAPLAPPDDPFAPETEGVPGGASTGAARGPAPAPAPPPPAPAPAPARPRGPQRVPEGATPPRFDAACIASNFAAPRELASAGVPSVRVVARITVGTEGSIEAVDILRGHPLVPDELVIRAVRACRAEPARFPDGETFSATHPFPLTFRVSL